MIYYNKKYFKSALLLGLVLVYIFGISLSAKANTTITLNEDQIRYDSTGQIPNLPTTPDLTYYADNATASKLCSLKGGTLASFVTGTFVSCYDNFVSYWNGSSFVQVNSCIGHNAYFKSLTCSIPAPAPITCGTDAQCGTNGLIGSPFCQNGDVYKNFKTFTCNNPGTANSSCSNSTEAQLQQTCTQNQTCSNGSCVQNELVVSCYATPNPANTNQSVSFIASVTGGTGNYSYSWSGACAGSSQVCSNSFSQPGTKTATINVTSGNQTRASVCSVSVNQNCTPRAEKRCQGNTSYWYDSCGNQQEIFENCAASGKTCSNGSCVSITCNTNSDCGQNTYIGSPFCQGNAVYKNYKTYTCNNPGTVNSSCTNSITAQLQQTCSANQTCSSGQCQDIANLTVSCYATPNSANTNQSVSFIATATGGSGNYTYSWSGACAGSSQVCSKSFSQPGIKTATVNITSGSQTNSSVCSVNINQGCTDRSYQQCSGNNLYWYNSCGNQQEISQYCQNGCSGNSCNQQNISVQTNSATNISNSQATLNGYLYNNCSGGSCGSVSVWFQWGTSTSYGNETARQSINYSGSFSQNIANLSGNATYHFRTAAQASSGQIVYGQDMTFSTSGSGGNLLTVSKTARNLTSGNYSGFSNTIYANPSDMLMFMITIQATGNQEVQNVVVRDYLANNLIYKDQLVVSGATSYSGSYNYSGDINSGINLGTIPAGQTITITYQVQVASAVNFAYGTTTLTNNVSVTSSNSGYNPTSNASVIVTRTAIYGASSISTGLTNNFWIDSFFLPLLVALVGIMLLRSGMFFGIEKWVDNKKKTYRNYKAEKKLNSRIAKIRKAEYVNK